MLAAFAAGFSDKFLLANADILSTFNEPPRLPFVPPQWSEAFAVVRSRLPPAAAAQLADIISSHEDELAAYNNRWGRSGLLVHLDVEPCVVCGFLSNDCVNNGLCPDWFILSVPYSMLYRPNHISAVEHRMLCK